MKNTQKIFNGNNKGITLIALVVTIVVLLILAGISIWAITGENGIIKRAQEAKDETESAQVKELVEIEALESYDSNGSFNSDKFIDNVENNLNKYNPEIKEDEDSVTVIIGKNEVVVDKETGEIYDERNVTPRIEVGIYQTNGQAIVQGNNYDNVAITVKVLNKEKFESIDISLADSRGDKINGNNQVIGEGDKSFIVKGKGSYTATVKGIIKGEEKTTTKTITINTSIPKVLPTVTLSPNGGNDYKMPFEGLATIESKITSSDPSDNTVTYQYTWDTQNINTPNNWTNTTSVATIRKTDCNVGTYYLWVKVNDKEGKVPSRIIISKPFVVTDIIRKAPTISFGTNGNTTYAKTQNTTVTVTPAQGTEINNASLKYQWTQSTVAPAENTFTQRFANGGTVTKSDGTGNNWYLWILAKDILGNTAITKSNAFYLDNTPPTDSKPVVTATTNSLIVTTNQIDNESGIRGSTRQYAIKQSSEQNWGAWVTDVNTSHTFTGLALNQSYDVKTRVQDMAGNGYAESQVTTITTQNLTKPTITPSTTNITKEDITITISYPEIQGITKQYSFNGTDWNDYTGPFKITENKTIYARSIDQNNQGGDTTRIATLQITNIDKQAPVVTHTISPEEKAKVVTITIKATDTPAGVESINNITKENITKINEKTYEVTANGEYEFEIRDKLGNTKNYRVTIGNVGIVATPGEIVEENTEYTDETGTAVIPEGFAVVTDPDTIENGLVISDKPNDDMNNTAGGNQFVWVPVSKENFETEFVRQDFGNQNISDTNFINTQPESGKYYETTPTSTDLKGTTQTTINEAKNMYNSVKTNGGFYIGRYEAGKEGTDTLVIKKNATVYNNIIWGNSITDEKGGAVEKARGMYPGKSTLCYGVQWDAVMRWISKDSNLSQYLTNSEERGNYNTSNRIPTGSVEKYQMKKIYDMAGNVMEWTMEAFINYSRVCRGGNYYYTGSDYPVTNRGYGYPRESNNHLGFRVALYVPEEIKTNAPKLEGQMKKVYWDNTRNEIEEGNSNFDEKQWYDYGNNRWANMKTTNGSYFVWIPRFAYKITSGYHTNAPNGGTIEIKFLEGATNKFADGSGEIAETNPSKITYTGDKQNEWLVHPAFTSNAANGGGFGVKEGENDGIEGFWFGKFEATGTSSNVSVKPGVESLKSIRINNQYKAAKGATYGENAEVAKTLNSHMSKNSEWGAVAYLGQSQYGTKGEKAEQNTNLLYTGGSSNKTTIYTINVKQSTTHNPSGVYDMNGGTREYVASYVNNGDSYLSIYGGTETGDLYGANASEISTSTAYKVVYKQGSYDDGQLNYEANKGMKGDALWETSNNYASDSGSWHVASSDFPFANFPFFGRSGLYNDNDSGLFFFISCNGIRSSDISFRPVLSY